MNPLDNARAAFARHLKQNPYPGRGLVLGRMDRDEHWVIVYFIMGRSVNSRNRRFVCDGDRLWTEPVDMSRVSDPSLIIYDAMLALPGIQIVSNGDQTTTVYNALKEGTGFTESLATREREPDSPNFTPRITGMLDLRGEPAVHLSILKANVSNPSLTDRTTFMPSPPAPGTGYCLTTYMGDGDPLPSFCGEPLVLPVSGSASDIQTLYWDALHVENRVSLAVKEIDSTGRCIRLLISNVHG